MSVNSGFQVLEFSWPLTYAVKAPEGLNKMLTVALALLTPLTSQTD